MKKYKGFYDLWLDGKSFGFNTPTWSFFHLVCGWWFQKRFEVERLTDQLRFHRKLHEEYKNKYHILHRQHLDHLGHFGELPEVIFDGVVAYGDDDE